MVFKLFKSGDELYDESKDLIKRGEYDKARDYLQKSIDKEGGTDDVAAVKVALIDLKDRLTNVNAYRNLLGALQRMDDPSFDFGLLDINRDDLISECELTIRKIELLSSGGSGQQLMQKGEALQTLAQDFQAKLGERNLIILQLFRNDTTVTGNTEFYNLMAIAYETMADGVVWDNPTQAAEYQQIVSPALDKDDKPTARSSPDDGAHIYICRACYSAVSNRSDEISQAYYNQALQEMRAMEARLQAEIAALQSQIAFARMGR